MSILEQPFPDRCTYTNNMAKSLVDKLFFLPIVSNRTILDYGCANGTLLKAVEKHFDTSGMQLLGYDIDPLMIAEASNDSISIFSTDYDYLIKNLNLKDSAIILSSIIHEIYSYCDKYEIEEFWKRVFQFQTIVIRDMCISNKSIKSSNPEMVATIYRRYKNDTKLTEWESNWGSIYDNKSLIHFLLTYRYESNWIRELYENYLPLTKEQLLRMIPPSYRVKFIEHRTLPFLQDFIKRDFGFTLQDATHIKLIMEK